MFITIALIPLSRRLAIRLNALDFPDQRKVHSSPMPKAGGVAMALGMLIPVVLWVPGDEFVTAVLFGAGMVFLIGLIDDYRGLGYKAKFTGQIAATLIVVLYGGVKIKSLGMLLPDNTLLPDWFCIPFTVVVIVGATNAINLSDGLDGLAGGVSVLCFLCIGYLAYVGENTAIALLSVAVVGVVFGFLRFNTYPATLFMGDGGSQLLGFLAIALSLGLTQGNTPLSRLLPLILLGFAILDTVTVILERIYKGNSPFVADKNHFHHKLLRLGLYHTEAVFVIYMLQAFLVISAFFFRFYSEWFLLISYLVFSGAVIVCFFLAGKTGWKIKRYDFVDKTVKGRLRILKEKDILSKAPSRVLEMGTYVLVLFSCLLPATVPRYVSLITLGLLAFALLTRLFSKRWTGIGLRLSLYLLIPFIVYLSESGMAGWTNRILAMPYNLCFVLLAILVILTLKFTRRRSGFRITPMDFLILFIAVVVPNLPAQGIQEFHMGLVAAKIIVLFFSYEVLLGELRGNVKRLERGIMPALVIMGVRGFLG